LARDRDRPNDEEKEFLGNFEQLFEPTKLSGESQLIFCEIFAFSGKRTISEF
jgi:hypothetical protein